MMIFDDFFSKYYYLILKFEHFPQSTNNLLTILKSLTAVYSLYSNTSYLISKFRNRF